MPHQFQFGPAQEFALFQAAAPRRRALSAAKRRTPAASSCLVLTPSETALASPPTL
jgi:hypothetical protein